MVEETHIDMKPLYRFFPRCIGVLALLAVAPATAQQLDWGDAPATYASRKADNGPRHVINPALKLGKLIDAEANGLPSANANGDDLDGQDDEDGIVSADPLIIGRSVTLGIEASAPGFLMGCGHKQGAGNLCRLFRSDAVYQHRTGGARRADLPG